MREAETLPLFYCLLKLEKFKSGAGSRGSSLTFSREPLKIYKEMEERDKALILVSSW